MYLKIVRLIAKDETPLINAKISGLHMVLSIIHGGPSGL
jgi:hypothetical protein